MLTLTALCMQLLYGPEEGSCTEVTGEITTPFISPDQNLLQAVGETNPVCVCVCVWFLGFVSAQGKSAGLDGADPAKLRDERKQDRNSWGSTT